MFSDSSPARARPVCAFPPRRCSTASSTWSGSTCSTSPSSNPSCRPISPRAGGSRRISNGSTSCFSTSCGRTRPSRVRRRWPSRSRRSSRRCTPRPAPTRLLRALLDFLAGDPAALLEIRLPAPAAAAGGTASGGRRPRRRGGWTCWSASTHAGGIAGRGRRRIAGASSAGRNAAICWSISRTVWIARGGCWREPPPNSRRPRSGQERSYRQRLDDWGTCISPP